ncbi:serine/threonine-protein kinase grp isoform X2 [Bombyx mori]|uniref:non-specific serine/threonine protein kinase n=1 Tax=Bombyx mori TaxID=7091 RepID=A0A8R2C6B8_BOMMO|nr:serine/threonine-protein kinase grp isoform X2 [Bombyx mori]
MTEFVEGWVVAQVLGEGAYGEVRLLVHGASGAAVAVKAAQGSGGAREAALQRALRHPHVLRCLGERTHLQHHYVFLEYAQGGELFDRIEPDVGMDSDTARRYWRETLSGLEYLHARGVAHRDIKPENLLLDHHDRVKISDFGLATVFRHGGRERMLSRVCGTPPYAAPEVLSAAQRPYRAAPADLWSAAVVLVAMLAGELPWERASHSDARYAAWVGGAADGADSARAGAADSAKAGAPWHKLPLRCASLLRAALHPDPARRPALADVLAHPWTRDRTSGPLRDEPRAWCSQPSCGPGPASPNELSQDDMEALLWHSQPAHADELVVEAAVSQRLVRRRTRVWLRCGAREALAALEEAARAAGLAVRALHVRVRVLAAAELRVRAWAAPLPPGHEARAVLEFRRSRGCGLQFKRCFLRLRAALQPLAAPAPALGPALPLAEPMLQDAAPGPAD